MLRYTFITVLNGSRRLSVVQKLSPYDLNALL